MTSSELARTGPGGAPQVSRRSPSRAQREVQATAF